MINAQIKIIQKLFILVLLGLLSSCEKKFVTHAKYNAPQSNYGIEIKATGVVKSGADISDNAHGEVNIFSLQGNQKKIKIFVNNSENTVTAIVDEQKITLDHFSPQVIKDLLIKSGYEQISAKEIEETFTAIEGVLLGSKGTIMKGQSQYLEVDEITFIK